MRPEGFAGPTSWEDPGAPGRRVCRELENLGEGGVRSLYYHLA